VRQAHQNVQSILKLMDFERWELFFDKENVKGYKLKSEDKIHHVKAEGWI